MKCIQTLLKATSDKKVGNHKVVITAEKESYYYHWTCICEVNHKDRTITITNGGYKTPSTTRAINCYKNSNHINRLICQGFELIEK